MSFEALGLSQALVDAANTLGYKEPTPVQSMTIPSALTRQDLMVAAQTGTGKTASFAMPALEHLFPKGVRKQKEKDPKVLVLAPTRELAIQILDSFEKLGGELNPRCCCLYGGVNQKPQIATLKKGVDILIACPGRLLDLMQQSAVDLSNIDTLILDEADRMLDMGFVDNVKKIIRSLPVTRQTLLFSATFSSAIETLSQQFLTHSKKIMVSPPNSTVERIQQAIYHTPSVAKKYLLAHLVTQGAWEQVLVFTRTKHGANRLCEFFNKQGLSAAAIHGNKSQSARNHALEQFKSNQIRLLIATDIAARGLDIDQLPHVVNFELPNIVEDYVHRIGRTGRAGQSGMAISLVCADENRMLKSIERVTQQNIPVLEAFDFDGHKYAQETDTDESFTERKRELKSPLRRPRRPAIVKQPIAKPTGVHAKRDSPRKNPANNHLKTNHHTSPSISPTIRNPEEFLDDDFDNIGNRADYPQKTALTTGAKAHKPSSNKKPIGSRSKPNPIQKTFGHGIKSPARPSTTLTQAPAEQKARNGSGGRPQRKKSAVAHLLKPAASRFSGFYDERVNAQPKVKSGEKTPVIIRKGERLPEQLTTKTEG